MGSNPTLSATSPWSRRPYGRLLHPEPPRKLGLGQAMIGSVLGNPKGNLVGKRCTIPLLTKRWVLQVLSEGLLKALHEVYSNPDNMYT